MFISGQVCFRIFTAVLQISYATINFVSELIQNGVNTQKCRASIGEEYMIAKDSAKHDEHGASFSDLCKIMSPSKKKK